MKKKLKEICEVKQSKTTSLDDDKVWILNLDKIESHTGKILEYEYSKRTELGQSICQFDENTVLYSKLRPYLNKVVLPTEKGFATSELVPLVPKENITRKYLAAFLRSNHFVSLITDKVAGTKMPRVVMKDFFEVEIPVPTLSEQQKIAAELDTIQSAIDNKKQQLSLLDEAVKSEFVEMFGENPVESGKWKIERLGDCLYGIENGKSFVCSAESRKDDFPAILKLSSVTYGEFIPEENKALLNNDMFVADAEVHKGDLLFTRKNTPDLVGMSAYVFTDEKKLMMPDLIFRLNTRDCLNKIFLWKLINHTIFRGKIRNLASGAAESMSNISKARLQTLEIPVPPLSLQNQFANFVQQIDKAKSIAKQQLADLQELLDSKMQQYFA